MPRGAPDMRLVVPVVSSLLGCGPPLTDNTVPFETPSCDRSPIALTCGETVDGAFVPLAEGSPMTMVHGPAGGWSLSLAVSATNSGPFASLLPTVTVPSQGDVVLSANDPPGDQVALTYDPLTCTGEYADFRAYFDQTVLEGGQEDPLGAICDLAGAELDVRIDFAELTVDEAYASSTATTGRTAACTVKVAAELDPQDLPNCDPS